MGLHSIVRVLALVMAIDEYGADAEYVICGIGIRKRTEYRNGSNTVSRPLLPHVYADIKVLGKLTCRYSLFTTESELSSLIPMLR